MGAIAFETFGLGKKRPHLQDESAEFNARRAAFAAYLAGQTFPDGVFNEGLIFSFDNNLWARSRANTLSRSDTWTRGAAFAAFQTLIKGAFPDNPV